MKHFKNSLYRTVLNMYCIVIALCTISLVRAWITGHPDIMLAINFRKDFLVRAYPAFVILLFLYAYIDFSEKESVSIGPVNIRLHVIAATVIGYSISLLFGGHPVMMIIIAIFLLSFFGAG